MTTSLRKPAAAGAIPAPLVKRGSPVQRKKRVAAAEGRAADAKARPKTAAKPASATAKVPAQAKAASAGRVLAAAVAKLVAAAKPTAAAMPAPPMKRAIAMQRRKRLAFAEAINAHTKAPPKTAAHGQAAAVKRGARTGEGSVGVALGGAVGTQGPANWEAKTETPCAGADVGPSAAWSLLERFEFSVDGIRERVEAWREKAETPCAGADVGPGGAWGVQERFEYIVDRIREGVEARQARGWQEMMEVVVADMQVLAKRKGMFEPVPESEEECGWVLAQMNAVARRRAAGLLLG